MPPMKKVAILGGTGALGEALIPALLKADFEVTCVTRTGSKHAVLPGVVAKTADYTDIAALTEAFNNHDAVVEAFNPAGATHQGCILKAVLAAGVRHIITPDFSGNTFHPNAKDICIFNPKLAAQQELERIVAESDGKLAWTAIVTGPWYDWALEKGIFWINKANRTITRYGSGNQKYSMSRRALNGEALVAVLSDHENYRNRPAYFASHTVLDVPFGGFENRARALWQKDTEMGIEDRLNSKAYAALSTVAMLDENNRYGSDFGGKIEPGWGESEEALVDSLKKLLS
ncbi:NAD(P)-binding protein [Colletotrichum somersetense]|nr:NAD(P)-binding protein [Colletotrichum somersetense]